MIFDFLYVSFCEKYLSITIFVSLTFKGLQFKTGSLPLHTTQVQIQVQV